MTDLEEPIYPERGNEETVAPVVSQVTGHLLNRPPKEQPTQVTLPPGVDNPKR